MRALQQTSRISAKLRATPAPLKLVTPQLHRAARRQWHAAFAIAHMHAKSLMARPAARNTVAAHAPDARGANQRTNGAIGRPCRARPDAARLLRVGSRRAMRRAGQIKHSSATGRAGGRCGTTESRSAPNRGRSGYRRGRRHARVASRPAAHVDLEEALDRLPSSLSAGIERELPAALTAQSRAGN